MHQEGAPCSFPCKQGYKQAVSSVGWIAAFALSFSCPDQFTSSKCKTVTNHRRRYLCHPTTTCTGNHQTNTVSNRAFYRCRLSLLILHDSHDGGQSEFNDESNADWLAAGFGLPGKWKARPAVQNLDGLKKAMLCDRIEWIRDRFALTDNDMASIIRKSPEILGLSTESNVQPTTDFLQERLQLSDAALSRMICKSPGILGRGIGESQSLQHKLDWLHDRLQVTSEKQLGKLVARIPAALTMSVADNLAPTMDVMEKHLGLHKNETAIVFRRPPTLLSYNFSLSTRPKMDWLQERFALDRDQLRRFVKGQPMILAYKMEETLEPKLVWLKNRLGVSEEVLQHLVVRVPTILCSSMRTVDPKLCFLQSQVGNSLAIDAIVHCPVLLACSLEARLKQRIAEALDNGIALDVNA